MPIRGIPSDTTRVNGFTEENGLLYKHGEVVNDAVSPREGMERFAEFLTKVPYRYTDPVYLLAHNSFRFDGPILHRHLNMFENSPQTPILYV